MAFSKNLWKSNTYYMDVDIKNRGINYVFESNQDKIEGCLITGELYNKADIENNIKNIEILETEITATTRSINDVDAIISGANSVKDAGHDHTKYLYDDPTNKDYPLGIIVRDEDSDLDWVKKVLEYQQSEEFKTKFNDRYDYTYVLFEE